MDTEAGQGLLAVKKGGTLRKETGSDDDDDGMLLFCVSPFASHKKRVSSILLSGRQDCEHLSIETREKKARTVVIYFDEICFDTYACVCAPVK